MLCKSGGGMIYRKNSACKTGEMVEIVCTVVRTL